MTNPQASNEERIYSNKLLLTYCRFLERQFGPEILDRILDQAGMDRIAFADLNGFQTPSTLIRLRDVAKLVTGVEDLAYKAGRSLAEMMGPVSGFIAGITSPEVVMKKIAKVERAMALKTRPEIKSVGARKYEIVIHFRDGFREAPDACRNRIGCYESAPRFFGLPYAKVEHPECAFRGAEHCVYTVTMPEYRFIYFRHLAIACMPLVLVFLALYLFTGHGDWGLASLGAVIASLAGFALVKHFTAQNSLVWNEFINDGLTEQNRSLENTLTQIQSLHQLTFNLSQTITVQAICDQVVQNLVQDFKYDSSQIWLLDEDLKKLSCRSARGYGSDLQTFIMNTQFELGVDWDNPYGLLVQTLEDRKTLVVNDVEETLQKLTKRTRDFLSALNLSSFIITPLFDHEAPVGILTAENHGEKKLDNKDRLLFQSISNSVASSIVKADLFESMQRKIEQRGRQLELAHHELMAAKEMAIQSEKLSSLGQMAAGVAHEINNPLNFLVNIFPDLNRDIQALDKLRRMYAAQVRDPGVLREAEAILKESDLESHLEEMDFVFERINKALSKSTRIANSLKVFSRTSSKETIGPEKMSELVRDAMELIPQKNRGDIGIDVSIPDHLVLRTNRTEIEQAIINIINNAIDAMQGKGDLAIHGRQAENKMEIEFRDSGPGIPEAQLKKIFDPFFTTKPPGKGTGLGLTIVAEIVKKYGGQIQVESVVGKGTTFRLVFPLA